MAPVQYIVCRNRGKIAPVTPLLMAHHSFPFCFHLPCTGILTPVPFSFHLLGGQFHTRQVLVRLLGAPLSRHPPNPCQVSSNSSQNAHTSLTIKWEMRNPFGHSHGPVTSSQASVHLSVNHRHLEDNGAYRPSILPKLVKMSSVPPGGHPI